MNKVLIIDDHPDTIYLLQNYLEREKYTVLTRNDGAGGIEAALQEVPDVIIMDVMMDGMSGIEACKTLSNSFTTSHIPVIIMTAKADFDSMKEAFESGAVDFVKKPFIRADILVKVHAAMRLSAAQRIKKEYEYLKEYAEAFMVEQEKIIQTLTVVNLTVTAVKRNVLSAGGDQHGVIQRLEMIEASVHEINESLHKIKKNLH
mgnify:CR=1 FL=1